jgi:predicted O-methyltransferase YrrM
MDINFLREKVKRLSEEELHPNHSLSMTTIYEKKFLHEIVKLLKPESVLVEVGCYSGGSIAIMANSAPEVTMHTIDLFSINGTDKASRDAEFQRVSGLLSEFKNVTVHSGNAFDDFGWWNTPIDLLFDDGAHEDPSLTKSMSFWLPFLKPGGILLMHDNHVYFPDVQKYINGLIASGDFYQIDQVDTLAVFIKREK